MKMLKRILKPIGAITYEGLCLIRFAIVSNVYNVAIIVSAASPYIMYVMGQCLALERGSFTVGAELFLPLVIGVLAYYMKSFGNRANKGSSIPRPAGRFTTVDNDGEVTVEQERLQEMILYVADLEDWLEKRGML